MSNARQVVVIGAHILPYINGQLMGRCAGFEIVGRTEFKEARGIDVPYVLEQMPTIVGVSFNMTLIRTIADGGAQGAGMMAQQPDISRMKYFTVLLKDRRSDLAIFRADQCVALSESWMIAPKDRLIGRLTCAGILFSNESSTR